MQYRLIGGLWMTLCLGTLPGCGVVSVQSTAPPAPSAAVASQPRTLISNADTRQLPACLHCAP